MVRTYIRKTTRRSWTVSLLNAALRDMKAGRTTNSVSKQYTIPVRTLNRYFQQQQAAGGSKEVELRRLGNFATVFTPEQESRLVGYILRMSECGYGLTGQDLRNLAFQYAEINQIDHPFNKAKRCAGLAWYNGFRRRHPCLALRKPEQTSMARSTGFNREAVNRFYDNLERILAENHYPPNRIWNCDETGASTVPNKTSKVLASKGCRQVGAISSAERGVNTTIMMCVSAAGNYMPPMFIFPRQRMHEALKTGAPEGSIFTCNPSGWSNVTTCSTWFDNFLAETRPTADSPVLLILDGHASHTRNIEMIEKAVRNHVTVLSIPPHTSHRLQPLDVTVMGPLKTKYGQAIERFLKRNRGKVVTVYDVAALIKEAIMASATVENARSGFEATGIWPFNRNLFTDGDFASADFLDEQAARKSDFVGELNRSADKSVQTEDPVSLQVTTVEVSALGV